MSSTYKYLQINENASNTLINGIKRQTLRGWKELSKYFSKSCSQVFRRKLYMKKVKIFFNLLKDKSAYKRLIIKAVTSFKNTQGKGKIKVS